MSHTQSEPDYNIEPIPQLPLESATSSEIPEETKPSLSSNSSENEPAPSVEAVPQPPVSVLRHDILYPLRVSSPGNSTPTPPDGTGSEVF